MYSHIPEWAELPLSPIKIEKEHAEYIRYHNGHSVLLTTIGGSFFNKMREECITTTRRSRILTATRHHVVIGDSDTTEYINHFLTIISPDGEEYLLPNIELLYCEECQVPIIELIDVNDGICSYTIRNPKNQ